MFRHERPTCLFTAVLLLFIAGPPALNAQEASRGRIYGVVTEAGTGLPVTSANVYLQGTKMGAVSDQDGHFNIKLVPPAQYTIVVGKVGYAQLTSEVTLFPGQEQRLEFELSQQVIEMEELVIEETVQEDQQKDKLLQERQQAVEIQDAIGSEEMSRTGSGDAAEAVSKVTGASVIDGKYVYIRGLGDRYSSTRLNGSELPSADPYRKSVHMDLFPSELLDKIVTIKTFSPDKPGNFSGGSVEMWTKRFPEGFTFSFSQSASINPQVTFEDKALTYPGGDLDWLGMDDGTREIPDMLRDHDIEIPTIGEAWNDDVKAQLLDRFSKAFNPVMAPTADRLPMNQSYSVSMGNQLELFGQPLGVLGTFSYSRSSSYYDDGTVGRWQLTGSVSEVDELNNDYLLNDESGSSEALWGGLMNISYRIAPDHEIGFNYMHNQSGKSEARYLHGSFPRDLTGNAVFETRTLKYTERRLDSYQLRGEHDLPNFMNSRIEWSGSFNNSRQEEPDLRYFTDNFTIRERGGVLDTTYAIRASIYPQPNRYFRDLEEDNANFDFEMAVPFKQWAGLHSRLKYGGAYNSSERNFRERRFEFRMDDSQYRYLGDPYYYWSHDNIGLKDSEGRLNRFGNYVLDATEERGSYDGESTVGAGFAMVELPLTRKLQFIGGLRVETTSISVVSHDPDLDEGMIDETDMLPAANFVYLLNNEMNLRAAYGRTLARPTFRELAPYSSFDFVNDLIMTGNENLKRTLIDNFDLRWEWFVRSGEILSGSFFYKKFTNPIERVIKTINGEVQYQNVDRADVYGVELEARQYLDRIHPVLQHFMVGGNLSLVHSEVSIAGEELTKIRAFDPDAPAEREMQGQSPYVLNLDVSYMNDDRGTTASLLYNIFGKRMSEVSLGGTPDVFEMPRGMLDFNLKQRVWRDVSVKFAAKNLLDAAVERVYPYNGKEFASRIHKFGRVFSVGVSYSLSND